jgi:hypothetical protein
LPSNASTKRGTESLVTTSPPPPEFSVVFSGDTMEPIADVAPPGDVRFVLVNQSDEPHDFALIRLAPGEALRDQLGEPLHPGDEGVLLHIPPVAAGDSVSVTEALDEGRYALVSNSLGEYLGTSLFELTVQPVGGDASDAS